jgi:hypothetical protein
VRRLSGDMESGIILCEVGSSLSRFISPLRERVVEKQVDQLNVKGQCEKDSKLLLIGM